ncbi:MerR family transcriptional regulator [Actinoallomurus spadix]|uniref:HTH merR-type domain-containing protein n=1 Tax=Actinoallomurus spadix TaxID=79912 RepID=A0ABP3G1U4_9ACTN|nr:MerR family transcriptional regulator [Actinoallomurus spadix]MCO5988534.1 MerR family transcriptional regulator [Actinoallomurus spadix]
MTPDADASRTLSVGELARATGLTVRALHHYDRLGLLSPARDGAGRRCYGPAEVRRLHRILALRGFGLSLAEIQEVLDGAGTDLRTLLRRQLEQTEERIAAAQRLRGALLAVIGASAGGEGTGASAGGEGAGPSVDELAGLVPARPAPGSAGPPGSGGPAGSAGREHDAVGCIRCPGMRHHLVHEHRGNRPDLAQPFPRRGSRRTRRADGCRGGRRTARRR